MYEEDTFSTAEMAHLARFTLDAKVAFFIANLLYTEYSNSVRVFNWSAKQTHRS